MSQATIDGNITAKGYQQVTSLSSAASLTVATGAKIALIQAETQDVRWRDDGTAPTTSVGNILFAGQDIWYTGDLTAIKFIEVNATAKSNVAYYAN